MFVGSSCGLKRENTTIFEELETETLVFYIFVVRACQEDIRFTSSYIVIKLL
jgi:hypothetical protein